MVNIENKRVNKVGYILYQDLGNYAYARWFDQLKAVQGVCYLADERNADLVEANLGLGWYYAENKDKDLEFIKEVVPFIEQGLMNFLRTHKGKEKSKTGEDGETEDERELQDIPINKKDAMEQFRMLEKMMEKLIGMQKKEETEKALQGGTRGTGAGN
eukprot:544462-Heterocapsa_arctica.AAC.1